MLLIPGGREEAGTDTRVPSVTPPRHSVVMMQYYENTLSGRRGYPTIGGREPEHKREAGIHRFDVGLPPWVLGSLVPRHHCGGMYYSPIGRLQNLHSRVSTKFFQLAIYHAHTTRVLHISYKGLVTACERPPIKCPHGGSNLDLRTHYIALICSKFL